ncbi:MULTISPECIES: hypothetical protein [Aequorivita]|uniref:Anti-sigma factor n=2 Tax=Aequorivita TaxID=153265 RepID=A0AB35YUK9_9FLAO|nr:hypothetical protein [Aequorivita sp. Ant34-E75]WGF92446.1 hypothetical protein QCQ61_14720 [Aequorivita sp. Ant34-E75]
MELGKINKLLAAYFEGNTSLAEEKVLKNYFNNQTVAEEHRQYQPLFMSFEAAKEERSSRAISLGNAKKKNIQSWWYAVAAVVVTAFGVGAFYFSQPQYTQEEREALAAFEKSKEAMMLLSENLNKGTERLTFVGQFETSKDKIFE